MKGIVTKAFIAFDFGAAGFNAGNAIAAANEGRAWSALFILTCAFLCGVFGFFMMRGH